MEELLSRALKGERKAEEELFRTLRVRFVYLAKRRLGSEIAEDVAQEACAIVFEKYRNKDFAAGFEAWAHQVLRNVIGNHLQARERKLRNLDSQVGVNSAAMHVSDQEPPGMSARIIECLNKINMSHPLYARVLNLSYQGYTTREICQRLKIKPNYLYVILNRGRSMLKRCLERGDIE